MGGATGAACETISTRDNSVRMLELARAEREGDVYFAVVAREIGGERMLYRFRPSRERHLALKRSLELRPFDTIPGVSHHYFSGGSYARLGATDSSVLQVRVEEDRPGKNVDVDAPRIALQTSSGSLSRGRQRKQSTSASDAKALCRRP